MSDVLNEPTREQLTERWAAGQHRIAELEIENGALVWLLNHPACPGEGIPAFGRIAAERDALRAEVNRLHAAARALGVTLPPEPEATP